MASREEAKAKFRAWRKDPILFAWDNFRFEPDEWQRDALTSSVKGGPYHRLIMKACTGPGKTAVLAIIGWHRLACFCEKGEHPKGAALSITKDNLTDNLWPEMSKWQQRSKFLTACFTWTKSSIYANDHPETWFLSARSFAKDADQEAIGRSLSGLHSRFPFVLLDETGDMPPAVGKAAEQIFTGGPEDALIAGAGNPTAVDGLLYLVCGKLREGWEIITITADPDDPKRTPRVSVEHAASQIKAYGRDNPWVMATILGLFPPGGFNNLLTLDDVESAMRRSYKLDQYRHAPKIIGVDVARDGDDQSAIFKRQGLQAFEPKLFRNAKSQDLAGWVAQIEDEWRADGIIVDGTGGYGASLLDALSQMNRSARDCQFSSSALNSDKYYNKRAEIWYEMAEWVKSGGALPDVPGLLEELTQIKYSFKGDKIIIEPKDQFKARIGRSPDLADALAVTFASRITPKNDILPVVNSRNSQAEEWSPFEYL